MIKTTVTLTCDLCGREIQEGSRYYVEDIDLHHFSWSGENIDRIEDEDMERRTRDLCKECCVGLYGPKEDPGEKAAALISKEPTEEQATTEDVATGEAVELDGKTYTEYQPEPITPKPIASDLTADGPALQETDELLKKKKRRSLTDEQKAQIIQLRKDGMSFGKISDATGVAAQTAYNVCASAKKDGKL